MTGWYRVQLVALHHTQFITKFTGLSLSTILCLVECAGVTREAASYQLVFKCWQHQTSQAGPCQPQPLAQQGGLTLRQEEGGLVTFKVNKMDLSLGFVQTPASQPDILK